MFTLIMFVLAIVFIVWFSVSVTKGWNKQAAQRRAGAEAQAARHGGQFVLEWNGPRAQGAGPRTPAPPPYCVPPRRPGGGFAPIRPAG